MLQEHKTLTVRYEADVPLSEVFIAFRMWQAEELFGGAMAYAMVSHVIKEQAEKWWTPGMVAKLFTDALVSVSDQDENYFECEDLVERTIAAVCKDFVPKDPSNR
jgi:hypothetical protein